MASTSDFHYPEVGSQHPNSGRIPPLYEDCKGQLEPALELSGDELRDVRKQSEFEAWAPTGFHGRFFQAVHPLRNYYFFAFIHSVLPGKSFETVGHLHIL